MTDYSVLCKFIAKNPADYKEKLEKSFNIRSRRSGRYTIFNYGVGCDFSLPEVQEARGIIIDTETLTVVCLPFRKFGNYNESYADDIDWSTARVEEKVDGSIIKLWRDPLTEEWRFSTNGTVNADEATLDYVPGMTFGKLIRLADNYKDIPFDTLDGDLTYIFELVSPLSRVVIDYGKTSLYHIGTRSRVTGEELSVDIGIKQPHRYPLSSLEDCLASAKQLNREDNDEGRVKKEGFVVVDARFHRVKIKSPDYLGAHFISSLKSVPKKEALDILINHKDRLAEIYVSCPEVIPYFKFYDYKLSELAYEADRIVDYARALYAECEGDRGAVAKVILSSPLSKLAFRALTVDSNGSELLFSLPIEKIVKLIPDYERPELSF